MQLVQCSKRLSVEDWNNTRVWEAAFLDQNLDFLFFIWNSDFSYNCWQWRALRNSVRNNNGSVIKHVLNVYKLFTDKQTGGGGEYLIEYLIVQLKTTFKIKGCFIRVVPFYLLVNGLIMFDVQVG